jgi:hypothetical protein
MSNDPVRTVFHMDKDSRLVSVFCSAVEHQAAHAGLDGGAGTKLAEAAEAVCREAMAQGVGEHGIDVTLDTFHDRMEVEIHYRGQGLPADAAGNVAPASAKTNGGASLSGQELLSRVDRVHCKAEEGIARVTLIKYLPAHH